MCFVGHDEVPAGVAQLLLKGVGTCHLNEPDAQLTVILEQVAG